MFDSMHLTAENDPLSHLRFKHGVIVDSPNDVLLFLQEYIDFYVDQNACGPKVILGADDDLRKSLCHSKLEEMLSYQQHQRNSLYQIPYKCIFCREVMGIHS